VDVEGDSCVHQWSVVVAGISVHTIFFCGILGLMSLSSYCPCHPLCWGRLPLCPCAQQHLSSPQEQFWLHGVETDIQAGQHISFGQWATYGVCLHYTGMHGVPHLWGICASIVMQVVIMGQCVHGMFRLHGGEWWQGGSGECVMVTSYHHTHMSVGPFGVCLLFLHHWIQ
jgi:hypothetical protein